MRRFSTGLIAGLIIGLLIGATGFAIADSPIKLIVDGQEVKCDVPPQIINGRTLVPARHLAEALGAAVTWDGTNRAVIISSDGQNTSNVVTNIALTEKEEFKALSTEADLLISETEALINSKSPSVSELQQATEDLKQMSNKFLAWGNVMNYNDAMANYIKVFKHLNLACIDREYMITADFDTLRDKATDELKKDIESLEMSKASLQGELTRLRKVGLL